MPDVEVHDAVDAVLAGDVRALLVAAARVNGRPALSDHLALDLAAGGGDGFVAVTARDADGRLVGYGQASPASASHVLEIVWAPDTDTDTDTARLLLPAGLAAVAERGGIALDWWVLEPQATHERIAAEHGMTSTRTLFEMRRPLPTGIDVEVGTRSMAPGADDLEWLAVNNRAFAGHGEQSGWTVEDLRRRQAEDWFDPDGVRIHERDGRMAAFCWTKVHPATGVDPALGEIYVIAVDPDFQGLGLGRQLTLAGLDHLAGKGLTTGMLWVDADNGPAVGLYEQLGFTVHSRKTAFRFDLHPGR